LNKAIGVGLRRRGRPRKVGGDLATVSMPFRRALRNNFGGLTLNSNIEQQQPPASRFKTNPKVRPSSTEMTLSPYQSLSSPAMNPFVPTSYAQMGGTSSGYGGAGLYGYAHRGGGLFGP
jgi:hypothetical protein